RLAGLRGRATTLADPAIDVTWVFYTAEEVAAEHNGLGHLFAQRPDLVAGDAAILGEPTDAALEVGCQGTMRVQVTFRGARAHTARPWMGRNALHRAGPPPAPARPADEARAHAAAVVAPSLAEGDELEVLDVAGAAPPGLRHPLLAS